MFHIKSLRALQIEDNNFDLQNLKGISFTFPNKIRVVRIDEI